MKTSNPQPSCFWCLMVRELDRYLILTVQGMDFFSMSKFRTHWLTKIKTSPPFPPPIPHCSTCTPWKSACFVHFSHQKSSKFDISSPCSVQIYHHFPSFSHIFRLSFRPFAPALADLACPAPRSVVARRKLLQSGCRERYGDSHGDSQMGIPNGQTMTDLYVYGIIGQTQWTSPINVFKKCVFWHQHHLETNGLRITNRILSQDHIIGQNSAPWQCVVVPLLAARALVAVMSTTFSIRYIMIYLLFDARSVRWTITIYYHYSQKTKSCSKWRFHSFASLFLTVSKVQRIIHNFQRGNGCGHQHHRFLGGIDASRGGQQGVETSGTIDGEVPQADQTRVVRQTSPKCVKMCQNVSKCVCWNSSTYSAMQLMLWIAEVDEASICESLGYHILHEIM